LSTKAQELLGTTVVRSEPIRILVADDQADVREALRLLLKAEGYTTETVSSPAAA
jgi:CheY-like chemotaxis protein